MADIVVPGPVSGRRYGFKISGDTPTVDEQMRIDASIRQYEDQFAGEFESQYGQRPAGAEANVLDYLGEFPKGFGRGAVNIGELGALGIAGLLPEEYESPTREFIRRTAYNLKPQVDIGLEDTVSGKFGEAFGSFAPLVGMSVLPGGQFTAGALAVGAGAGEASERARAAGATVEERGQALLPGAAVGALDLLPISFIKALGRGEALNLSRRLARIAGSAGAEGAQEAATEVAQNLIAQGIYDPEQGVFTNTGESLGYGAGVGGLVQALIDLALPKRSRGATVAPQDEAVAEEPVPAEEPQAALQETTEEQRAVAEALSPDLEDVPNVQDILLPDPRAEIDAPVLDALGIPEKMPVRKRIKAGKYKTKDEVLEALREYAAFLRKNPETRASGDSIQSYVDSVRRASLEDVETELPERAEQPDGVENAGDRARPEDAGRKAQPAAEAAPAPDAGGLDMPPEPLGSVGETEDAQQSALKGVEPTVQEEPAAEAEPEPEPEPTPEPDVSEAEFEESPPVVPTNPPEQAAGQEGASPPPATDDAEGLRAAPMSEDTEAPASETETETETETAPEFNRNATPGAVTGAAGQAIPESVPPAPRARDIRSTKPRSFESLEDYIDRKALEKANTQTPQVRARNAQLRSEILDRWRKNASPELQEYIIRTDMVDPSPDLTTSADKRRIVALLDKKVSQKKIDNPEWAAKQYFSKNPDPMTAIDTIAYDSLNREDDFFSPPRSAQSDISKGEIDYYEKTGKKYAKSAVRWIRENLGPDAVDLLRERQRFYYEDKNRSILANIDERDSIQSYKKDVKEHMRTYSDMFSDSDIAAEQGLATESMKEADLDVPFSKSVAIDVVLHPRIISAIQNGDINGAISGIIATAGSTEASMLAAKLRPFLQNTKMRVADPETMRQINRVFGGRNSSAVGVYMPVASEQRLQAMAEHSPERAALLREFSGTMLFNSENGLTATTFLHEAVHAATMQTLRNPSHPLTRQVEALLQKARDIMPASHDALFDRLEFVSEAMTNRDFIQQLSQIDLGTGRDKYTIRQRVMHALRNFARQLIGRRAKPLESGKDALDTLLDNILAPDVDSRGAGTLYEAAFRQNGYRDAMNNMATRTIEATPQNTEELVQLARATFNSDAAIAARNFTLRSSMPLQYVVENAKKFLPVAPQYYDALNAHDAARVKNTEFVDETVGAIDEAFKNNSANVLAFNRITNDGSRFEVDVRAPRENYSSFWLSYKELDAEGDVVRTVRESRPTRDALNARIDEINARPAPNQTDARLSYDPGATENQEKLRVYDELKALYESNTFGPEGRAAVNRAFELPEKFRKDIQAVLKRRLDAMPDSQRTSQERIYQKVFNKIFAEQLVSPFRSFQRNGDYGLSYVAKDETGTPEIYKHAFPSESARRMAIRYLTEEAAASPDSGIDVNSITPYDLDTASTAQQRPSMEFLMGFLNKIDRDQALKNAGAVDKFLEFVMEATPETSFVKMFQKRRNVRGFDLDITPLEEMLQTANSASDTVANIKRSGMRMANQVADIEYRSMLDRLRQQLSSEYKTFVEETNMAEPDPLVRSGNQNEARMYRNILDSYGDMATYRRANWSRNLNAIGYTAFLGMNVSTAALTLFQITNFLGPMLMPKYGSRNFMGAFGAASRLLGGSGASRTTTRIGPDGKIERFNKKIPFYDMSLSNRDYTQGANMWLKPLFMAGDAVGAFTRSAAQEHIDATKAKGVFQKVGAWSGLLQHHLERYVRETTMASTYMLELHKTMPEGKALSFSQFQKRLEDGSITVPEALGKAAAAEALRTTDMVNGSIYAATAPLWSQGNVGSVVYLFRRFPLSMLNLLSHTLKEALKGATPEDRRVAKMQFASMVGALGMLSGISGIPGFYMMAALYNAAFKDDEDEDFETMIRTGVLGERGLTGLVDYYTGLNVSSRLGLSGVFYRPGFSTQDQTLLMTIAEALGGPTVGLFNQYTDRVPYFFNEGEYWRATEAVLPTALGNMMKSMRFYSEGARTLRHDPIIDEIGPFAAGAQFFGFMPKEYARQLAENRYQRGVDNAINTKIQKLLARRNFATRYGTYDQLLDVEREIQEFNRKYPEAEIGRETKKKSYDAYNQTSSRMHHGITYSRKNEALLQRNAADFDNAPATAYSQ